MRHLASLAVRFRVTFLMIYLAVLGAGAYFGSRLNLDMYPDISFPAIMVITTYTGASPEDIEQLVTRPIEEACAAVEGVKHVNSESRDGASMIFIDFEWGTDLDQAEIDVRRGLDFVREQLPSDAQEPITFAFDPSMQPVLIYSVSGPYDQARLRDISEREIEPRLERIHGVASAATMGGLKREIHIEIMPDRLAAAGISVNQLIAALRMENVQIPGGDVVDGGRELSIQVRGAFHTVDEIREIVVGLAGGVPIQLSDVTEVRDTVAEQTEIIRANKRSAIMLAVRKQSGANSVQTVGAVEKELPDLMTKVPAGVRLNPIFNQADFISRSIGNLSSTGLLAIAMAVLVLLVFLGSVRAAIIVGMAIPVSLLVTFTAMYGMGLTLNVISMAGLALAVGMLVDNSIVVLENIYRHAEMDKTPARAAIDGASEVATAIFGSTLTTVAVFLPILFVPGLAGAMFRDMATTICISLGASFFVAITLIPLAASTVIKKGKKSQKSLLIRGYSAIQSGVLSRRGTRVTAFVLAWLVLFTSAYLVIAVVGTDFFPKQDQSMILLQLKTQIGSSVEHTNELSKPAEDLILENVPEVELVATDVGVSEGFAAIYSEGKHSGLLRLRLKPLGQRERRQPEIEHQIRKMLADIPGLDTKVFMPFSPMGESDITIEILGHDIDTARRVGKEVTKIVEETEGAEDVVFSMEEGKPEFNVIYDRQRMSRLGLTSSEVSSTVSAFFQGTIATIFREEGQDYNIRVRAPRKFRDDPKNLGDLLVTSRIAGSLPLRSIATITEKLSPLKITRKDQQRLVTVDANSVSRDLKALISRIDEKLGTYPWPDGFRYQIGGSAEDFLESFMFLGIAFVVSMFLVYMVMASLFESFITPMVIGFTIPLGMIGFGLALFITNTVLSIVALIGAVILVGIVVNNSIVLVDHANQLCAGGMGRMEAVLTAGRHRLRPILMTTLTTCLAMVPLAMEMGSGAESWSPLARVVIGGLLTATLITLLIVPIIYYWFGGGGAAKADRRYSSMDITSAVDSQ
jgi:HAE1 family hydrophobic/amphiphilic exporter-1